MNTSWLAITVVTLTTLGLPSPSYSVPQSTDLSEPVTIALKANEPTSNLSLMSNLRRFQEITQPTPANSETILELRSANVQNLSLTDQRSNRLSLIQPQDPFESAVHYSLVQW